MSKENRVKKLIDQINGDCMYPNYIDWAVMVTLINNCIDDCIKDHDKELINMTREKSFLSDAALTYPEQVGALDIMEVEPPKRKPGRPKES